MNAKALHKASCPWVTVLQASVAIQRLGIVTPDRCPDTSLPPVGAERVRDSDNHSYEGLKGQLVQTSTTPLNG